MLKVMKLEQNQSNSLVLTLSITVERGGTRRVTELGLLL